MPAWLRGELRLSSGFDFRSGDYGESVDTDIYYVPLTATYEFKNFFLTPYPDDRFELSVTVPYLRIRGPGEVVGGTDGPVSLGAPRRLRETDAGLGDVLLRATYLFLPFVRTHLPALELSGRVKLPTADEERNLGTGEADYTVQIDLFEQLGRWTPFATLGYRFMGDPPDLDLDDGWLASAGLTYRLSSRFTAGLIYDWREAITSTSRDAHELFPYVSFALKRRFHLVPYAIAGLSDGSPDYGVGLMIRWTVPFR